MQTSFKMKPFNGCRDIDRDRDGGKQVKKKKKMHKQ